MIKVPSLTAEDVPRMNIVDLLPFRLSPTGF